MTRWTAALLAFAVTIAILGRTAASAAQEPAPGGAAAPIQVTIPTVPGPATPAPALPQTPADVDALRKAEAAVVDAQRTARTVKTADIDLSVPESPAFTALGLSPDTVARPTSPREFATALLNGVDREGNFQTGAAIDVAPYLIYAGDSVTLHDYRTSRVTRILSRTQTSFATTKGASDDDKSVRMAVGVHATLFDSEDPRLNNDELLRCYSDIPLFKTASLPVAPDETVRQAQAEILERARKAHENETLKPRVNACREQFRRDARWNGTSWTVAAAAAWVSPTGLNKDFQGGSATYWTSWSYGFDSVPGLRDTAQVIAHVRHHADEVVVDEDLPGGSEIRDTTFVGGRFRAGTTSFGLSFEASYVRTQPRGRPSDASGVFAFAAERRLSENLWLAVSFGGDVRADSANSKGMSVLSAFKYAFTHDPGVNWR